MIAFIEGDLVECQLNLAVIQVGGIGYEVHIPLTTSEKLPALGQEIKLYTQAVYREDAQTLYGFSDRESRDFFRMIGQSVGIGPKSPQPARFPSLPTLKTSIASGDVGMLSKAQGLGKNRRKDRSRTQRQSLAQRNNLSCSCLLLEAPQMLLKSSTTSVLTRMLSALPYTGYQSNRSRPGRAKGSRCPWPRSKHRGTDQKGLGR